MRLFKKKRELDKVEERFNTGISLVKDLTKADKDRLMRGLELAWQGYEEIRKVRTRDEKTVDDIDKLDHTLDLVEIKEKK